MYPMYRDNLWDKLHAVPISERTTTGSLQPPKSMFKLFDLEVPGSEAF